MKPEFDGLGHPPIALVDDVSETHRDIKGYYVRFGFMDTSTLDRFLSRVVLPSLIITIPGNNKQQQQQQQEETKKSSM